MVNWCTIVQISIVHRKLRPKLSKKMFVDNQYATCFREISKQNALSSVDYLRTLNMSIIIKKEVYQVKDKQTYKGFPAEYLPVHTFRTGWWALLFLGWWGWQTTWPLRLGFSLWRRWHIILSGDLWRWWQLRFFNHLPFLILKQVKQPR